MPRATTVYDAWAVCDPLLALDSGHEWYVDLSPVRGPNVVRKLFRFVKSTEDAVASGFYPREQGFAKLLLTGLRGSGKTTELKQFSGLLQKEGFFPVFVSAYSELNLGNLTNVELLMSLVWALQEQQQVGQFRVQLPGRVDEDLTMTLASVLVEEKDRQTAETKLESEFGLGAGLPFYLKVKAALKSALAVSSDRSRTLRANIIQRTSAFTTSLNHVLDEVQAGLQRQQCKGLVFIVDELDRLDGSAEMLAIAQLLFERQSDALQAPRAHIVYTFPIQLLGSVYLGRVWPEQRLILPDVKVTDQSGGEHTPGIDALTRLVAARVEVDRVFDPPGGVRDLVRGSGGYVRDLLRLVRYAASRTDTVIGPAEIEGARRDLASDLDPLIWPALLPLLADVDREKRLSLTPEYARLLDRNLVLTYLNDEGWADLHPAVREAPAYRKYTNRP